MVDLPWRPRTRQQEGARTEQEVVKQRGGRVHPRSGAGSIKDDGSSAKELIEVKDANVSHTLDARILGGLYKRAVQQNRKPVYVVRFANGVEAVVQIRRYKA